MSHASPSTMEPRQRWTFGVLLPLVVTAAILLADFIEGPKTAYIGILSAIPMLAAVFGRPLSTAIVSVINWLAALTFGLIASDGNVPAQQIRLIIIALFSLIAVLASAVRARQHERYLSSLQAATEAEVSRKAAVTDFLTELPNRRGLQDLVTSTNHSTKSVVIFDLDGLKSVNDQHGHLAGDAFIRIVAERIKRSIKSDDIFGRWGGDEFVAVLPVDEATALETVNRVIANLKEREISIGEVRFPAAVSAGVAGWWQGAALETVITAADLALYRAKAKGGSQAMAHSQLSAPTDK